MFTTVLWIMASKTQQATLSFPLVVSQSTYFHLLSKMFSYLAYFCILGIWWEDGRLGYWLAECGLALELKPPKAQRFEVSHLLALIAQSYSAERPFIPARMRSKTGNGMQIVISQWYMSNGMNEGSNAGQHIKCTLISRDRSGVQPSPEVFVLMKDGERKRNQFRALVQLVYQMSPAHTDTFHVVTICSFTRYIKGQVWGYSIFFFSTNPMNIPKPTMNWFYNQCCLCSQSLINNTGAMIVTLWGCSKHSGALSYMLLLAW